MSQLVAMIEADAPGLGGIHPNRNNRDILDEIAKANLRQGLYLSQVKTLVIAIRDPRVGRCHLLVLACIIEHTNRTSGMAYPGLKRLVAEIIYYENGEPRNYTAGVIRNAICELISWGYLVSERRGPKGGGRAIAHYATHLLSKEEIGAEIAVWCRKKQEEVRNRRSAADVTTGGDATRGSDVTAGGDIRAADVTAGGEADVTTGGESRNPDSLLKRTGTSLTGGKTRASARATPLVDDLKGAHAAMMAALGGEVAYAERNITITASGKLTIGEDFRAELRSTFTDEQIDSALDCTLAAMGSNRNKAAILQQVRRQCVFRRADAAKAQKMKRRPSRW